MICLQICPKSVRHFLINEKQNRVRHDLKHVSHPLSKYLFDQDFEHTARNKFRKKFRRCFKYRNVVQVVVRNICRNTVRNQFRNKFRNIIPNAWPWALQVQTWLCKSRQYCLRKGTFFPGSLSPQEYAQGCSSPASQGLAARPAPHN